MVAEAQATSHFVQLSLGDTLAIIGLGVSLVGNILQFQRTRSIKNSLYNALVGVFNEVGWMLSYCIARQRTAANGSVAGSNNEVKAVFQEMGQFAISVDHQCRLLHEHIVSIAKTLKIKDARWQGQFFGMSKEDIDKLMKITQGN